jgi:hypothetical protein
MKSVVKKIGLRAAASALSIVLLAGCSSAPPATPIDKRAPGQDITPEARADKRDAPVSSATGAQTPAGK